jgi:hypothetical protein
LSKVAHRSSKHALTISGVEWIQSNGSAKEVWPRALKNSAPWHDGPRLQQCVIVEIIIGVFSFGVDLADHSSEPSLV